MVKLVATPTTLQAIVPPAPERWVSTMFHSSNATFANPPYTKPPTIVYFNKNVGFATPHNTSHCFVLQTGVKNVTLWDIPHLLVTYQKTGRKSYASKDWKVFKQGISKRTPSSSSGD